MIFLIYLVGSATSVPSGSLVLMYQQMNNNNKANKNTRSHKCAIRVSCVNVSTDEEQKQSKKTQEQLSSPLSQVLKTYDFGNFEKCELIIKLFNLSLTSHPCLYHKSRNLHKWTCSPMWLCIPLVQTDPVPVITEKDSQFGSLFCPDTNCVKEPINHFTNDMSRKLCLWLLFSWKDEVIMLYLIPPKE